jgi:hypothetical protein
MVLFPVVVARAGMASFSVSMASVSWSFWPEPSANVRRISSTESVSSKSELSTEKITCEVIGEVVYVVVVYVGFGDLCAGWRGVGV